jgi:hypothetical protein
VSETVTVAPEVLERWFHDIMQVPGGALMRSVACMMPTTLAKASHFVSKFITDAPSAIPVVVG